MQFFLREDQASAYANYAAVEQELHAGRVRLETRPPHVRLDVTSRCNLRCLHCVFTATRASAQDMAPEVLERFEREILPSVAALQYADEGEPFLFHDFDRLTAALDRHRPAFSRIFTNGTSIDEHASRQLIACGLADLAVSLDGATEATFARIRRTSLAPIIENLARLRDLKRALQAQRPVLSVHSVVMLDNLAELAAIVRLAHRLGAAEVVFYALFEYTPEMAAQSSTRAVEETRGRPAEALEVGLALGLPVRFSPRLPAPPTPEREPIDARFYLGSVVVEHAPARMPPGCPVTFQVTVHNRSPFTWYGGHWRSLHSDVAVAAHLYDAQGTLLEWDGRRTPLPRALEPGGRATVEVEVDLPERGARCIVGFDLVNEHVRWFGLEQRIDLALDETLPRVRRRALPIEATPLETGRCEYPWKYASIKANGDVFPCRFLSLAMGNLRTHSFAEIWNSERYLRLRASIVDDSYAFCRGAPCPFAAAPPGMFRSRIEVLEMPGHVTPGGVVRLRLAVTNEGTATWNAEPVDGIPARFMVSGLLYDDQRRLQPFAPQRIALPGDVPPGTRVEVPVDWPAPRAAGDYILGFEINRRPIFEFTTLGNPVCEVALRVEARERPGRAPEEHAQAPA